MRTIGRPLAFDPDTALRAAMVVFWTRGYEASSLQHLLEAMGLSKSSFYQAFKSKHVLFQQAIALYRDRSEAELREQLSLAANPKQFIIDLFEDVADAAECEESQRGCLLMNTATEFAQSDPRIAALVSDSLILISTIFEEAIRDAQKQALIPSDKDPKDLAKFLMSNLSGLKNMVKAGVDRESLKKVVDLTLSVLHH